MGIYRDNGREHGNHYGICRGIEGFIVTVFFPTSLLVRLAEIVCATMSAAWPPAGCMLLLTADLLACIWFAP